jgi:hypothetical protein
MLRVVRRSSDCFFGSSMRSTPFSYLAWLCSTSMGCGNRIERANEPKKRSLDHDVPCVTALSASDVLLFTTAWPCCSASLLDAPSIAGRSPVSTERSTFPESVSVWPSSANLYTHPKVLEAKENTCKNIYRDLLYFDVVSLGTGNLRLHLPRIVLLAHVYRRVVAREKS